jgi:hypothetical protein
VAISTVKISDTIEWSKRLMFNRNPVIGNSLEPALTAANMVRQTILGPPFDWWWNNEEVTFQTTSTPNATVASSTTSISILNGVLTATVPNSFFVQEPVIASGFTSVTQLNGVMFETATVSSTNFTASTTLPNSGPTSDSTGIFTALTNQDYVTATPEFSHIGHASVYDPVAKKWFVLEVENDLSLDSITDRPRFINPHTEDANGNMHWRLMPSPDNNYPVSIHIQKTPSTLIVGVNSTWAPIPDFMQTIYNWGFQAIMWLFADDARFQFGNQKFLAGLLGRAQGLTEEERNTFLNNWSDMTGSQRLMIQQGVQGRGV